MKKIKHIFMKLKQLLYKLLKIKSMLNEIETEINNELNNKYILVFSENFENDTFDNNIWTLTPKGPSHWNSFMGGEPEILENEVDGKFIRFNCIKHDGTYLTSGIKTKTAYGDGKFECEARFKSGISSWPAIWMTHPTGSLNNYESYYEVDLSEYYELNDYTCTTYHCPQSMRKEGFYINSTKTKIKLNDWNKFSCTWDDENIIVYINGEESIVIPNDNDSTHFPTNPDNRTFIFILSMQYANPWLKTPNENELPLYMDVRNIKYYKLNNI